MHLIDSIKTDRESDLVDPVGSTNPTPRPQHCRGRMVCPARTTQCAAGSMKRDGWVVQ